jgi:hypothetical protein
MHPIIHRDMMQARVADLHRQAQRDALARAAGRARLARTPRHSHPIRGLPAVAVRRMLTVLGGSPWVVMNQTRRIAVLLAALAAAAGIPLKPWRLL